MRFFFKFSPATAKRASFSFLGHGSIQHADGFGCNYWKATKFSCEVLLFAGFLDYRPKSSMARAMAQCCSTPYVPQSC